MSDGAHLPARMAFCVGAAKAGTSWLYQYLRGHPQCHLRSVKELHYFDALDFGWQNWHVQRLLKERAALLARGVKTAADQQRLDDLNGLIVLQTDEKENNAAYLAYVAKGMEGARLCADVTPAYALLSSGRFANMARLAPVTRFIYILRDPVARLWSHVRMNAARRAAGAEDIALRAGRIFWRFGRGRHPGIWARSDYRATLERLRDALDPSQLLVLFYEELFSPRAVERICDFLGIDARPADFGARVHAGPGPADERQAAAPRPALAGSAV